MSAATEAPARTCTAYRDWNGKLPLHGEPAAWALTYGCMHEHVSHAWMCEACAERLRDRLLTRDTVCLRCENGPEPHDCRVLVDFKPLRGAA